MTWLNYEMTIKINAVVGVYNNDNIIFCKIKLQSCIFLENVFFGTLFWAIFSTRTIESDTICFALKGLRNKFFLVAKFKSFTLV